MGRYWELFPTLAQRGIAVYGYDQRGWGKSVHVAGERGATGLMTGILSDVAAFVRLQLPSSVPVFLMGHSFGSAQIIAFASTPEYADLIKDIRGLLLASPYLAFDPKTQTMTDRLAFVLRPVAWLFPKKQVVVKANHDLTTSDPEVTKSGIEDELLHATTTLESTITYLDTVSDIRKGKTQLDESVQSLWFAYGTADTFLDHKIGKQWWENQNVKDKKLVEYEGWRYQLHADTVEHRKQFAQDVGDWILTRID